MTQIKITDVCEIQVGKTPSRSVPSYWGAGSLWLSIADMNQGSFLNKTKETITEKAIKDTKIRIVPVGTVLFSFKLSIGKVGITQVPMYTNEAIAAFIVKDPNRLDTKYLYYVLKGVDHTIGSKRAVMGKTLNKEMLKQIQIPLPSLEEQKRIVRELDAAEILSQKRKQAIALLDDYLKAVFLEMFGDPVMNPKGWKINKLENLVSEDCPLTYGIVQPGNEYTNGVYLVRPIDLVTQYIGTNGLKKVDPLIENKFKRTRLKGGELLMCVRGTTGVISIAEKELNGANVTRGITPMWFSTTYNALFAFHQLLSVPIKKKIQEKTYGSALKQINLADIRALKLVVPPIVLQNKFAEIVKKAELIRERMSIQSDQFESNFNVLMQNSFKV